jgi:hypothetical protein
MFSILLLATVASLIFFNSQSKNSLEQKPDNKTYKYLVKDLMEHHGITQTTWKNSLKINKDLDGIIIGSDNGFIHLSDLKPIELYIGLNKFELNTWNVNEAIKKIKKILDSDKYNSDKKTIISILDNLLKYQNYYYLKKYLKYKNLYNNLKNS